MATIHFALDAVDGAHTLAAGYGRIVGQALSVAGLRAQGFAQGTYRGNRLSTIDHTDAGYNTSCEPGWYRTPDGVQITRPLTTAGAALAGMIEALRELHQQLLTWDEEIAYHGPGYPDWQRTFAHDALATCHGHNYLVMTDTSRTVADRTTYCETLLAGASDGQGGRIASALQYYAGFTVPRVFRAGYPERAGTEEPPAGTTRFYAWADPDDPSTALTLGALHMIEGTIPAGTVLGHGATWHQSLTA